MPFCHSKGSTSLFQQKQPCTGKKWGVHIDNVWGREALGWETAAAASSTCKVRKSAMLVGQSLEVGEESGPHSRGWEEKKSRWMRDSARGSAWGNCEKEQSAATQAARCDLWIWCTLKIGFPCGSRPLPVGFRVDNNGLCSATCSARSWLPPCLTRGYVACKQL